MVQESIKARYRAPLPSTVSEKVSVSEFSQRLKAGRRENLTPPQDKHQQQPKQYSGRIQTADERLPPLATNGKFHRRSIELPPRPYVQNLEASKNQPNPQIKVLEELSSRQMRVKLHGNTESSDYFLPSQVQDRHAHSKRTRRKATPILYCLRLLILGVGIGAITGTLLSVLDPTSRLTAERPSVITNQPSPASSPVIVPSALKLTQEIMPLKTVVQQMAAKNPKLTLGSFFVDLDTGAYLDLNGSSTFASASMIKFPILVAFFQDVDAGKIRLDEMLTLQKQLIGGGSGDMQYLRLGTKFTALQTVTKMITISDNTATNMILARLGGAAALNQRFQSWGLTATEIRNSLPDLAGTNSTSPRDLANLMALVNQGDLMSLRSRDRLLDIMRRTKTNTLLTPGLGQGATIAHKTGDIGLLVGDVGLVDMPSGKRYLAVAMVKRPHNDNRAQELIRQVSRAAYQEFNKPVAKKSIAPTPFVTTTNVGGASTAGTSN